MSCCKMKDKVIVGIYDVLSEEQCSIPDSIMADYMLFDVVIPSGKPVISFKYCPWCGTEVDIKDLKITDVTNEEENDLEPWQTDSSEDSCFDEKEKDEEAEGGTDISGDY